MDLPSELALIHQPARLKIMGTLYKHRDLGFPACRDATGLTDGNLATHVKKLGEAGYIDARRVLTRDGFELRYRITRAGHTAFRAYLAWLRTVLQQTEP